MIDRRTVFYEYKFDGPDKSSERLLVSMGWCLCGVEKGGRPNFSLAKRGAISYTMIGKD